MQYLGETAAFATAVCWTVTGISFEWAGKRVGSFAVNLIRLVLAFGIMTLFNLITRGQALPLDATGHAWFWLSISGLIGFVLGDLFLFQAYVLIGTRLSMLVMASVPPLTAVMGLVIFGERLSVLSLIGMAITLAGIVMVIFVRGEGGRPVRMNHSVKGVAYAFIGAVGQAAGLITSKLGMGDYSAFAATQIRIIAGILGFLALYALSNRWREVSAALKHGSAMKMILLGSFFGPFLGVSLSLLSLQYTKAAIASTIMALLPVLVIPPAVWIFKERIGIREIGGAVLTVVGVAVLVLGQ